jgi:integrase
MATISKRGTSWFVQIRRKGHKSISKSLPTKGLAQEWARKIEREIDTQDFQDGRAISSTTVSDLIDRYSREMQNTKPFGRNKRAVLESLKQHLGMRTIPEITSEIILEHVKTRQLDKPNGDPGAGGVTISVELTYLGAVFKAAKQLWKLPIDTDAISAARTSMRYQGLQMKSKERTRRPTEEEIKRLCAFFAAKGSRQKVPMPDLIRFAIATAMRLGEIINLQWSDLNESDRTIIIRNRKHPQQKQGNDQEVPLLGDAFSIIEKQPKGEDQRIFPVADGTVSSIFPRACAALGILDLRFHDLRHEGVSRLFEQGYRIEQVAVVSGHRDWKMLARYTQIRAKDLHR